MSANLNGIILDGKVYTIEEMDEYDSCMRCCDLYDICGKFSSNHDVYPCEMLGFDVNGEICFRISPSLTDKLNQSKNFNSCDYDN